MSTSSMPNDEEDDRHRSEQSGADLDAALTRRLWMLKLGQTAAGFGLVGIARAQTGAVVTLPAGLYEPSTSHLGHALMSESRFHPIPLGSPTDYVQPRIGPFQPKFFSPPEFSIIRRVAGLMLGAGLNSESDLQADAVEEVAEWIDLCVSSSSATREAALGLDQFQRALAIAYYGAGPVHELESSDPQQVCRHGLLWLAEKAGSSHNGDFLTLGEEDQIGILRSISDERTDKQSENAGTRFFALIKFEAIRGFYTSRAGLKELDYKGNAFYAASPGCRHG
jgi:hypothetical protein